MATDVEESDTDEHERPAPPKRQCTRICSTEDNNREVAQNKEGGEQQTKEDTNKDAVYEELVKHDREMLKMWQACQVTKGFVDNNINKIMEKSGISTLVVAMNVMEERAVSMAIRNHGLAHSADLHSQDDSDISSFSAATSSDSLRSGNLDEQGRYSGVNSSMNRSDEINRQKDVLEKAIAEAIKKKGLSALSLDYD